MTSACTAKDRPVAGSPRLVRGVAVGASIAAVLALSSAPAAEAATAAKTSTTTSAAPSASSTAAGASGRAACDDPLPVYREGKPAGERCPAQLAGLTPLDLGDAWVPYALSGAATRAGQAAPAYSETFVELANQRFGDDEIAAEDRYLEFFGVPPSLRVVLGEMDADERHACHDRVDDAPLGLVKIPVRWESREQTAARRRELARQRALVTGAQRRLRAPTPAALAERSPAHAKLVTALAQAEAVDGAVKTMQEHLTCEGLLPAKKRSGVFDFATQQALRVYQRKHWIVASGELDGETRDALASDSRELDFRLALRVLRQRVADAAGLIEDGSARGEWGTVLGRQLDPPAIRYAGLYAPLENGAPDRVSAATEAAALALGWKDFDSARAFLRDFGAREDKRVAVQLPAAPSYHRPGVELRAVIDRGDVSYDYVPGKEWGPPDPKKRRPVIVLYARDGDRETALVRWPTTIGGWQEEKTAAGAIVRRYKGSDVGPRLWRDLVVAPAWYPPENTPDDELIRARNGKWELKDDLIGPGYRSAYGLAMLVHHQVVERADGALMVDRAIRTHGSVNYRSIVRGASHGCHRLYNHHVLRLTSFILRHHDYTVRGPVQETLNRRVRGKGRAWGVRRTERGYAYELDPPIAVEVLEGTVVSRRKEPIKRARYASR